jgi:sec-independent protein translocase protein TatB
MLSIPHMIVVFVVVLVVFGPNKLPELARGFGKLMAEFRKASTDFRSAFEEEMRDLERQAREVERKKTALAATAAAQAASQPATLATPSGAETQAGVNPLAPADGDVRATEGDIRAGSGLTVTPAADAVPRLADTVEAAPSVDRSQGIAQVPSFETNGAEIFQSPDAAAVNTTLEPPAPNREREAVAEVSSTAPATTNEHASAPAVSEENSIAPNDHHRQA